VSTAEQEIREYELVYVLRPDLDDDGVRALNERITQTVGEQAGTVTATELWGRRTLAYPIGKVFEGHYILQRINMPPTGTEEVDRILRFNENVMRYLLIRKGE
jgi:small subunit ribosomal protein S6